MVAGRDADPLGRSQRLQPVMRGVELGLEPDVDEVAGHRGDVGVLLAHVVHELDQPVAGQRPLALDLPVQVAGDPLVHQLPRPHGGMGAR